MKNKKKRFPNGLLQNSKFLFVISILISISIWLYMSSGSTNDTTITINNIPIQTELSDEARNSGLQIFSGDEQTASVIITGNRAILGSVNTTDITVTAAANSINLSGSYSLPVSAVKTNPTSNFQITSGVTPSSINVVVDYFRESTFDIQENIVYKVEDGFYAFTSLSSKSVVISGPQTEISKIDKVSAVATINGSLKDTVTTDAKIILLDEDGNKLATNLFTMDLKTVTATVSVLPEKTVEVKPVFTNIPEGLKLTDDMISIEPSEILLAGPKEVLDSTSSVKLEAIDFSTLRNEKKTFPSLGINIPADCRNISNSTTANVTLDLSSFASKRFTVSKFKVEGLSGKYEADVTQNSISVIIVGPKKQIDNLKENDITAIIDASDFEGKLGSVQVPVKFKIGGANSCWACGNYNANLTVSEK